MKFREITRAHIIAWRDDLKYRELSILATLLYHALGVKNFASSWSRISSMSAAGCQLKISGKGGKTHYIPLHPAAGGLILDYLEENESDE
jgi:hypothetical protein